MATQTKVEAMQTKPRRKLRWAFWALAVLGLLVCAAIALFFYVRSDSFRNTVRERVVADIQSVTGGRVELKTLTWNLSRLQFEATDLTIHGLEKPGEVPYAHLGRALVSAKVVSLLGRKIALSQLDLQHPVFHLIVYPDGSTNQPSPKKTHIAGLAGSRLFQIEIGQLQIHNGLLLLNDEKIPLDLRAAKVAASLSYEGRRSDSYAGKLSVGALDLKYGQGRQIASQADASFVIRKNAVDVSSLHWTSEGSSLSASGTLQDFRAPKVEASYSGKIDLRTIAQVFAIPELRAGIIEFNGSGRYLYRSDFYSSGNLKVSGAAVSSPAIRVSEVHGTSQFAIAEDRISLTRVNGRALGGSFTGDATLDNWANIAPTASIGMSRHAAPAKRVASEGHIQLAMKGIQVRDATRAVLPAKSPVQQLHLASTATGSVDVKWRGSPADSQTYIKVAINADPSAPPSALPLDGTVEATYYARADRLEVPNLALASRATRLSASGTLARDSQLRISLNTSDLSELEPVAKAFGATGQGFPAVVHGHASFNGTVTGKLSSPDINGRLEATNFDFTMPPEFWSAATESVSTSTSTPAKPAPTLHWDSLSANVNYSPQAMAAHNVLLRRGRADLSGDMVVGLENGELVASSPVHAHLHLRDTDLVDIQKFVGRFYPITGTLTGQLTLSGTKDDLQVHGRLQALGGTILAEPYRLLVANINIRGQQFTIENVLLQEDGGEITGSGSYNLTSRAFHFDATGKNFNLAHLARLQSKKISVGGTVEFTASGSGTPEQPSLSARLLGKDLVFSGEPAGDLVATAETRGHSLHLQAHSNTQFETFNAEGDIGLSRDLPAQIRLDLTRLDFDPLLRVYLAGKLTGHSSVSGTFLLSGPLRHPDDITVTGNVQQFSASVQNLSLHNDGPLRFTLSHQVASIQQMHVVGTDTDINATGTAQFAGERKLDLHANGKINMAILQTLDPNLVSSGEITFAVNATGTVDDPSMAGNVEIANGALALVDLPNGLSAMNGRLTFDINRLRIQRLTAKTGGGDLNLGGYVTYSNGLFFDLNTTGRDIRLRYPQGVSSQANASLRLVGSPQNSVLSGDITVTKFGLTQQFDLATYVERARQTSAPPSPDSPLNNVRLDVHIVSTPELRVETSLARLSGDVDLRLRGTVARPSVLGRVSIAEGDITFNGTTYHLERGDIIFANPVRIEPVINVEASARVRDYDITLGFHGTPDKLSVTYRSEPPLPSADIIALLAFGRTRQESEIQAEQGSQAASAQSFAQTASNAILGEALNSAVSSRVQKLFGISRIKIDPNLGGTEDNPNARLTIEQQISKNVTVTYLTNLGQYAEEVLQVEYNINQNISIVAVRDYTGVLAIDLRIRQRKR